jgi:hypothetical protein
MTRPPYGLAQSVTAGRISIGRTHFLGDDQRRGIGRSRNSYRVAAAAIPMSPNNSTIPTGVENSCVPNSFLIYASTT